VINVIVWSPSGVFNQWNSNVELKLAGRDQTGEAHCGCLTARVLLRSKRGM